MRPSPFRAASTAPPFGRGARPDTIAHALATVVKALPALLILALVALSLTPRSLHRALPAGPASLRGTASLRGVPLPPPRTPSTARVGICAPSTWCGNGACTPPVVGDICPPPSARATYANFQAADLIALDAKNSHAQPPAGGWTVDAPPPIVTPADCAAACAATPPCNVWVFCAEHESGCGECLPQYMDFDAKLAKTPPSHRYGRHGGCTRDGTFPYGTCSLKQAHNTTDAGLRPADDDDADSWISGVVEDKD